jgi:hypothetical protein
MPHLWRKKYGSAELLLWPIECSTGASSGGSSRFSSWLCSMSHMWPVAILPHHEGEEWGALLLQLVMRWH